MEYRDIHVSILADSTEIKSLENPKKPVFLNGYLRVD